MRRRLFTAAILAIVLAALAAPVAPVTHARAATVEVLRSAPGGRATVRAGHTTQRLKPIHAPASATGAGSEALVATADIQVNYNGFSEAARNSFEAAASVWEAMIVSSQVIHVDATWAPLDPNVLGSAGPTSIVLLDDNRWYPGPIAEALCECNAETEADISATFNSAFGSWYLGTDGFPPSNKHDFYTVVLHELGHGLGFLSSFEVDGNQGGWGFQAGASVYPMLFDEAEVTSASGGANLTDTSLFPNPSAALKSELTDGGVYFAGANVVAALGSPAPLYAPGTWSPGSSNSHFNEASFATGTQNALMTPSLANGEVIHDPGSLTLALFRDIGWTTAGSTPGDSTAPSVTTPIAALLAPQQLGTTAALRLTWPAASDPSGISRYDLERRKGTGAWVPVALASPTSTTADVALAPGTKHSFRLRAVDGANNIGTWVTTPPRKLGVAQETATSIAYGGAWTRSRLKGASGGYVRQTGIAARSATLTFNGTSAALVSSMAPNRGIAEVWLDGQLVATLDLYRASVLKKAVVWAPASALAPGIHTVEVRVTGTRNALATKNRVDVDAFLVWP